MKGNQKRDIIKLISTNNKNKIKEAVNMAHRMGLLGFVSNWSTYNRCLVRVIMVGCRYFNGSGNMHYMDRAFTSNAIDRLIRDIDDLT